MYVEVDVTTTADGDDETRFIASSFMPGTLAPCCRKDPLMEISYRRSTGEGGPGPKKTGWSMRMNVGGRLTYVNVSHCHSCGTKLGDSVEFVRKNHGESEHSENETAVKEEIASKFEEEEIRFNTNSMKKHEAEDLLVELESAVTRYPMTPYSVRTCIEYIGILASQGRNASYILRHHCNSK